MPLLLAILWPHYPAPICPIHDDVTKLAINNHAEYDVSSTDIMLGI